MTSSVREPYVDPTRTDCNSNLIRRTKVTLTTLRHLHLWFVVKNLRSPSQLYQWDNRSVQVSLEITIDSLTSQEPSFLHHSGGFREVIDILVYVEIHTTYHHTKSRNSVECLGFERFIYSSPHGNFFVGHSYSVCK